MLIDIIAGAQPNFMKVAPIIKELEKAMNRGENISYRLIHTGQHYDRNMSGSFFEELGIPSPDINLEAGSGSQAEQSVTIMIRYEKVWAGKNPNLCIVVGDVNSTMACSITAKKMGVDVAHVEGGIRSGDLMMPEEIISPVHPRTRKILDRIGIEDEKLIYTEPMGYLQFIWLVKHARAVITDSGGITEEATVLGVPCLTLRDTTERPETITIGTNELIGTDPIAIKPALEKIFKERWKKGDLPEKWDGKAAERIVAHLLSLNV